MSDAAALELVDIDGGYGEMQVLDDCSLRLEDGEIVRLIGPNGAGKSTVLKTAFGLLDPWDGRVHYHGREIGGMAPEDVVRIGIGYVPQTENVFGSLTVDENLRMGGVARAGGFAEVMRELYDRFEIRDEKRDAKARTLSGGRRQVLAFARALVMEPDVLLVDEPSAGLAPNTADEVFADVQAVNEMNTAILMVEQNARKGLSISDRGTSSTKGRFGSPTTPRRSYTSRRWGSCISAGERFRANSLRDHEHPCISSTICVRTPRRGFDVDLERPLRLVRPERR